MIIKHYLPFVIALLINTFSYGQDICAHATRVITLTNCQFQESFGTFNEANNIISYCNGTNTGFTGDEVIYAFVAPQSRAYTFELSGISSGKDLDMFLVNGCNDNVCLADTDGASAATADRFTIDLDINTVYYLSVDTDEVSGTGESNYTLTVSCENGPGISCSDFKQMECDRLYQDANRADDSDASDILDDHGSCTSVSNGSQFKRHEVIYNFTAPDHGLRNVTIDLNTHNPNVDLDLFVYDDCIVNTVNNQDVYHLDDCLTASSHMDGTESVFISAFAPNAAAYVVVDGQSNNFNGIINESNFEVYVSCGAPCDFGSETIECNSTVGGTTVGQKNNSSYYSCDPEDNRGNNWGPEKVFRFELENKEEITFDLDVHSQVDLNLYLLKGSCEVTKCVDLSKKVGNGRDEKIVRTLAPGVYYIVIEGYRGDAGFYSLTVTGCGCVADDELICGTAIDGSTDNASNYVEEIVGDCISNTNGTIILDQKDRVYKFQAPEAQEYTFRLTNLTSNLNLYLFENCLRPDLCVPGGTSTKAGTADESITVFLEKNQVVFADVDGTAANVTGDFTISVSCQKENDDTCGNCFSYLQSSDTKVHIDLTNAFCPDCADSQQVLSARKIAEDGSIMEATMQTLSIIDNQAILESGGASSASYLVCYTAGCGDVSDISTDSGSETTGHISEGGTNYYCCRVIHIDPSNSSCNSLPIPHFSGNSSFGIEQGDAGVMFDATGSSNAEYYAWDIDVPDGSHYSTQSGELSKLQVERSVFDLDDLNGRHCLTVSNSCGMASYCVDYSESFSVLCGTVIFPRDYPKLIPTVDLKTVSFSLDQGDIHSAEKIVLSTQALNGTELIIEQSPEDFLAGEYGFNTNAYGAANFCVTIIYSDCQTICICYTLHAEPLMCGQEISGTTMGKTSDFNRNDFSDCYNTSFPFTGPDELIPFEKPTSGPMILTMTHAKNVNLSLIILDENLNGVFVDGDANFRPCKGLNFSGESENGETFQDYQDPLPAGRYYALIEGTRPDVAGPFSLKLECVGECDFVDLNTNLDYVPVNSIVSGTQAYKFSLPKHAETLDAQNIQWTVAIGDSTIASGQGIEAILNVPTDATQTTVTVSWEKSNSANRCYQVSEAICFSDPYKCEQYVWHPSPQVEDKYQFVADDGIEVIGWTVHTGTGQIIEEVSTESPAFDASILDNDDVYVTLTYIEQGCLKVCSQYICITLPACVNELVSATFTGTPSDVEDGIFSYNFTADLPDDAVINEWYYHPRLDLANLTKIDSSQSLIDIKFDLGGETLEFYRVCVSYEIDGCSNTCCAAINVSSPYRNIEESDIVCDPIGNNWIAKSIIDVGPDTRLFWSYADGEIISNSENMETMIIPRRAGQDFVYLNYISCPFSSPDQFASRCYWNTLAYLIPTCESTCYDQCCSDASGLDSIVNNLPFFGCPSLDQCSFTLYQCTTEQGDCVYDLRFDDPETIDEEGGTVYDCGGNELFSYNFFANINIDRYQELSDCKLVWEPVDEKVEECPVDSICMNCEDFSSYTDNDSISASSDDWYIVNPSQNADAAVDFEELQIRIGSGSKDATYVGYNITEQSDYNLSLDISTSRDGKFYLVGQNENQVTIEFFPGLFGNCVVRGSNTGELSFSIQQNAGGISNFTLSFDISGTQIGITRNGLFQGNVTSNSSVSALEFCGNFGSYQVDNICIDVCDEMENCPDDCCGDENKAWLEDAKGILLSFCDDNIDGKAVISQAKFGDRCVFILPQNPGFFDITYVVLDCSGSLVFNFGGIANINQDLFEQLSDVTPIWDCENGDDVRCEPEGFGDISAYYKEKAGFKEDENETVIIDNFRAIFSPNPFSKELRLAISSPTATEAELQLLSIDGKLLYNRSHSLRIGSNLIGINSSELDLVSGIVVYQIITTEELITGKLIKVN